MVNLRHKSSLLVSVILRQIFAPKRKERMSALGDIRDLKYGKLPHAFDVIVHLNP